MGWLDKIEAAAAQPTTLAKVGLFAWEVRRDGRRRVRAYREALAWEDADPKPESHEKLKLPRRKVFLRELARRGRPALDALVEEMRRFYGS